MISCPGHGSRRCNSEIGSQTSQLFVSTNSDADSDSDDGTSVVSPAVLRSGKHSAVRWVFILEIANVWKRVDTNWIWWFWTQTMFISLKNEACREIWNRTFSCDVSRENTITRVELFIGKESLSRNKVILCTCNYLSSKHGVNGIGSRKRGKTEPHKHSLLC